MTTGVCVYCGRAFEAPVRRGRPRRYCTNAHRQAAYRRRAETGIEIPAEMADQHRWVRRHGKRPITTAGRPASVTDPATWDTLDAALASPAGDGIGIVLGAGIGCLDLDHAIDDDGRLRPWARAIIDRCPPTYIEISMSGRGLHVFGLLPEAPGRARHDLGVEIYSRQRYIAVTGNRLEDAPLALADIRGVAATLI